MFTVSLLQLKRETGPHELLQRAAQQCTKAESVRDWMHEHDVVAAFVLGSLYGLLIALPPSHLCTILTLTVASDDVGAFRVGAVWGLSHATTTGLIIFGLGLAEYFSGEKWEGWETLSEYAAGMAMILCGVYFLVQEGHYIREDADGAQIVLECECHTHPHAAHDLGTAGGAEPSRPAASSRSSGVERAADAGRDVNSAAPRVRDVGGAIMGAVQGAACPLNLVAAAFVGYLSTPARCAAFGVAFLVCSTLSTGVLSLLCSRLTREGGSWLKPKTIYRSMCGLSMLLGTVIILANVVGLDLSGLEWTDNLLDLQLADLAGQQAAAEELNKRRQRWCAN